jgi:hypothetical protein
MFLDLICGRRRYPSIQVEAFIVVWGRIIDLCNMHQIFLDFSPEQRMAVFKRLGALNVWSPLFPTGDYEMDLADFDNQRVAEILFELDAADEPGIQAGLTLRGKKTEAASCLQPPGSPRAADGLTHILADHAKKGTLTLSHTPAASAWELRKRFVMRTLTGDEMRRPLAMDAFNTGEADANARRLVEKMAACAENEDHPHFNRKDVEITPVFLHSESCIDSSHRFLH